MHVANTHIDSTGVAWVTIHEIRTLTDAIAFLAAELGCRHGRDGHGFCLISPPRWTYWIGGHHCYSLGGAVWVLGQRVHHRVDELDTVYRFEVPRSELGLRFG